MIGPSLAESNLLFTRPQVRAFLACDVFPGDDYPADDVGLFLGPFSPQPDIATQIIEVTLYCSEYEPKALPWFNEMIACAEKTNFSSDTCRIDHGVVQLGKWLANDPPVTELKIAIDGDYMHTNYIARALWTNTTLRSLTLDTSPGVTPKDERFDPLVFADALRENRSLTYFFIQMDGLPITPRSTTPRARAKELFVQEWPDRCQDLAGEIWEAVHRNAVESIPISKRQRCATNVYNAPPDVAGLLLQHVLDQHADPVGKEAKMTMQALALVAQKIKAKKSEQ